MKTLNKKTILTAAAVAAPALIGMTIFASTGGFAVDGSGGTLAQDSGDFNSIVSKIGQWLTGSLGKAFALTAFGVGIGMGIYNQSIISVVTGVAFALVLYYGPNILMDIFDAVAAL